jgi:hypothetical protein
MSRSEAERFADVVYGTFLLTPCQLKHCLIQGQLALLFRALLLKVEVSRF